MTEDGCKSTISLLFVTLILCTYQNPLEILESRVERSNTSEENDIFYLMDTFGPQPVSDSENIPMLHGSSTVSDNDGNIYTTGRFGQYEFGTDNISSITFGEISLNLDSEPTRTDAVYIAKYVPTQGWEWAELISPIAEDGSGHGIGNIRELQIAPDGGVIIAGDFRAGAVFGPISLTNENATPWHNQDGEPITMYLTSDVFIAKISPQGQWQWAKKIIGVGNEFISDIATDDSGNIFIIGSTDSNCVSFEAGAEQVCEPPCTNGYDWGGCEGVPQGDPNNNDDGRRYSTGDGALDFFIAKYDDDGNWLSSNTMNTSEHPSWTVGHNLAIDTDGSIIVSGSAAGRGYVYAGNLDMELGESWNYEFRSEFLGKINSDLSEWNWLVGEDTSGSRYNWDGKYHNILSIEPHPSGGAVVRGYMTNYQSSNWINFTVTNLTISEDNETHNRIDYLARISSSGEWLWAWDLGLPGPWRGGTAYGFVSHPVGPYFSTQSLSNDMVVDSFGRSYVTQCSISSYNYDSDTQLSSYEEDGILMVTRYDEFGHLDGTANLTNVVNSRGISSCNAWGGIKSIHIDANNNLLTTVDYWNNPLSYCSGISDICIGGLVISWRFVLDPNDLDDDGVPNEADLCPNSNPSATVDDDGCSLYQIDTDNDGVSNANDLCPNTSPSSSVDHNGCSPMQADYDDDGVVNALDRCIGGDDQVDEDSDGIPDDCDDILDTDFDGVTDSEDECEGHDDKIDVDGDSTPDGCDELIDSDNDGDSDATDVCPGFDDSADQDSDGIPDGCDQCPGHSDGSDLDMDGIPDGCDSYLNLDSDGDGVSDPVDLCEGYDDSIDDDDDGNPDSCEMWILTESTQRFAMERFGVSLAILFVFVSVLSRRLH